MAWTNFVGHNIFGILGDDDSEDPTQLLASKELILQARAPSLAKKASTQVVREPKNEDQQGGRGGRRGGLGFNRDHGNENTFGNANGFSRGIKISEDGDARKDYSERHPYSGPRGEGSFRDIPTVHAHATAPDKNSGASLVQPSTAPVAQLLSKFPKCSSIFLLDKLDIFDLHAPT